MHAYLIIGSVENFLDGLEGRKMVFPFAKIGDVRELNNFLRLKVTENTVIVLKDFDDSTEEAQNAFLKALEEPQENLVFVLGATNIEKILPTIVSRCEVKEMREKRVMADEERENIQIFLKADVGGKLQFVSKISKRDEAINFVNNLLIVAHEEMQKTGKSEVCEAVLKLKRALEANGNVGLQLTNFVVKLNSL